MFILFRLEETRGEFLAGKRLYWEKARENVWTASDTDQSAGK